MLAGIPLYRRPTGIYASQIPKPKAVVVTAAIINPRSRVDAQTNTAIGQNACEIVPVIKPRGLLWFMVLVHWLWFMFHRCTHPCCFLDAIQSLQCNS